MPAPHREGLLLKEAAANIRKAKKMVPSKVQSCKIPPLKTVALLSFKAFKKSGQLKNPLRFMGIALIWSGNYRW